jgi:hypothetical protein
MNAENRNKCVFLRVSYFIAVDGTVAICERRTCYAKQVGYT